MSQPENNTQEVTVLTYDGVVDLLRKSASSETDADGVTRTTNNFSMRLDMQAMRNSDVMDGLKEARGEAFPDDSKPGSLPYIITVQGEDGPEIYQAFLTPAENRALSSLDDVNDPAFQPENTSFKADVDWSTPTAPVRQEPRTVEETVSANQTQNIQQGPQAFYLAQQEANIQRARDAGNEDTVQYLEMMRDNENKTVYRDADTGAKVILVDGDSESIKPHLQFSHERALEEAGGLDQLIEQKTTAYQQAVEAGRMPQAVMDKELEILREAGTDSEKFAELRFENNGFFAEQASLAGKDPNTANDLTVIENVSQVVSVTTSLDEDGNETGEPKTEVIREASNLKADDIDMNTLIKVADGNQLTAAGSMFVVSDMMSSVMGRPMDFDLVELTKTKFEELLEEHGSVEALAVHLEQDMTALPGLEDASPEVRAEVIEAVKTSEGNSARFVATVFNDTNERTPPLKPAVSNPGDDPNIEATDRERRATDLQALLGDFNFGGNSEFQNIIAAFIAIFTGQELDDVLAKMNQNNPESEENNNNSTVNADRDQRNNPSGEEPGEGPRTTHEGGLLIAEPTKPENFEKVELRAGQIAAQTLNDSPAYKAIESQLRTIDEDLQTKLAEVDARGIPPVEDVEARREYEELRQQHIAAANEQKAPLYAQMNPMVEQVMRDARIYATNEMGEKLSEMYPELAQAANNGAEEQPNNNGNDDQSNNNNNDDQEETVALNGTNNTNEEQPNNNGNDDQNNNNNNDVQEETVALNSTQYTENPYGGPMTVTVSTTINGEPVKSNEGPLLAFQDGSSLADNFGGVSNPDATQVAMVNPFENSMNAFDTLGFERNNDNFGAVVV